MISSGFVHKLEVMILINVMIKIASIVMLIKKKKSKTKIVSIRIDEELIEYCKQHGIDIGKTLRTLLTREIENEKTTTKPNPD